MSILLRLVVAWVALAWSGSADRHVPDPMLDAPCGHVALDGPAVPPWRRWLAAFAPGLRHAVDAGRYLLLLVLLALPAVRTRH
jgi:hypothetical protein